MVQELTDKDFKQAISADLPVIIDFWASWCGPCKMLAPIFYDLSHSYEGKLNFAKISTEDYPEIAQDQAVQGIPCLIVFSKGQEVDRIIGFKPRDQLKKEIDLVLAKI